MKNKLKKVFEGYTTVDMYNSIKWKKIEHELDKYHGDELHLQHVLINKKNPSGDEIKVRITIEYLK